MIFVITLNNILLSSHSFTTLFLFIFQYTKPHPFIIKKISYIRLIKNILIVTSSHYPTTISIFIDEINILLMEFDLFLFGFVRYR